MGIDLSKYLCEPIDNLCIDVQSLNIFNNQHTVHAIFYYVDVTLC